MVVAFRVNDEAIVGVYISDKVSDDSEYIFLCLPSLINYVISRSKAKSGVSLDVTRLVKMVVICWSWRESKAHEMSYRGLAFTISGRVHGGLSSTSISEGLKVSCGEAILTRVFWKASCPLRSLGDLRTQQ